MGDIGNNVKNKAIGDLVLITFYYFLRVEKYAQPKITTVDRKKIRATQTVQFSVENVGYSKTILSSQGEPPSKYS